MAFFNAKGECLTEIRINTDRIKKKYVVYLDPSEDKKLIECLKKFPDADALLAKIEHQLSSQ